MNNNVEGRVAVEIGRSRKSQDWTRKTILRGRQELASSLAERPEQRVRLPGGGRPRAEKKTQR